MATRTYQYGQSHTITVQSQFSEQSEASNFRGYTCVNRNRITRLREQRYMPYRVPHRHTAYTRTVTQTQTHSNGYGDQASRYNSEENEHSSSDDDDDDDYYDSDDDVDTTVDTRKMSRFGVLIDVSGSMKTAFKVDTTDRHESVQRIHSTLTTLVSIVKEKVAQSKHEEDMFVGVFGLKETKQTCDLLTLLDLYSIPRRFRSGYDALQHLAGTRNQSHIVPWIREHLTESESRCLYNVLLQDEQKQDELIAVIPSSWKTSAFNAMSFFLGQSSSQTKVKNSEAVRKAKSIINDSNHPELCLRSVQNVSELLDEKLQLPTSSRSATIHKTIKRVITSIKPYIYGRTPMCRALTRAKEMLQDDRTNLSGSALFIISDGLSTDGNPVPIAKEMRSLGVTIVTCYLTSDPILNPKRLLDPNRTFDDKGRQALFAVSSTMRNTQQPLSYLTDLGWKLPKSGVSRLFIQANSLDVVNEFSKIFAHMND